MQETPSNWTILPIDEPAGLVSVYKIRADTDDNWKLSDAEGNLPVDRMLGLNAVPGSKLHM